jgi:hypothetical protein
MQDYVGHRDRKHTSHYSRALLGIGSRDCGDRARSSVRPRTVLLVPKSAAF